MLQRAATGEGMLARGGLALGARFGASLARIGIDRLAEGLGRALPRTPAQLARAEVVNDLLVHHAPADPVPLPPVRSVRLPGVRFDSSNCTNFLVELDFARERSDPALPATLYAKLPCEERATRAFAHTIGFWALECAFAARLAGRVPIRVPRVYASAWQGTRFVLLLENLHEVPGTRLFVNRDMAAGTTPERARRVLHTLADLHAPFWGATAAQREALLPLALHPFLSPRRRELTRALDALAIGPAQRAAPGVFGADLAALCRRAIAKWDRLLDAWYRDPLTLVHGDSHLANCFEYPSPEGPRTGMLDFQGVHWSKGMRDVQYFLINSLAPEVLADHEEALIDDYVTALAARGVRLDPGEARAQYRDFSLQTLIVGVVSLGLGALTEREETVRTVLARACAAVERVGFGAWLDAL
jgi:hypothetical protein